VAYVVVDPDICQKLETCAFRPSRHERKAWNGVWDRSLSGEAESRSLKEDHAQWLVLENVPGDATGLSPAERARQMKSRLATRCAGIDTEAKGRNLIR